MPTYKQSVVSYPNPTKRFLFVHIPRTAGRFVEQNLEAQGWDGKFIFLYIPSWSRYFTKFNEDSKLIKHKELIIQELKNRNIQIIDFESFLSEQSNIKNFYPLGWMGHFNSYGYKKIADLINDKTK